MNNPDCPFDAAHELQSPVEPTSPLGEALERAGIVGSTRDELMVATGLTATLVDKAACEVREAAGKSGMLVWRLRAAVMAAEALAKKAEEPSAASTWKAEARAQTEARLTEIRQLEEEQAEAKCQLALIRPEERTRCVDAVFAESPWLEKIVKTRDPLKSRVLGILTLAYWRRNGRPPDGMLQPTAKEIDPNGE